MRKYIPQDWSQACVGSPYVEDEVTSCLQPVPTEKKKKVYMLTELSPRETLRGRS